MKINVEGSKRTDEFMIPPDQILADEGKNSRSEPHTEESVRSMMRSYAEQGQLQPVIVRKTPDKKLELVLGFRRWRAAMLWNEENPDKPWLLAATVREMDDEEALVKNIVENKDRVGTSPVDNAHAQRRLREEFKWTNDRIAKFYDCSVTTVSDLSKLLSFPAEVKAKIHSGELAWHAAKHLTNLPADKILEVVRAAPKDEKGKHVSTAVRDNIREAKQESNPTGKGASVQRHRGEIRGFFLRLSQEGDGKALKALGALLVKFVDGAISDRGMLGQVKKLLPPDEAEAA